MYQDCTKEAQMLMNNSSVYPMFLISFLLPFSISKAFWRMEHNILTSLLRGSKSFTRYRGQIDARRMGNDWRMTSGINEIFDIDDTPLGRKNPLVYFQKTKQERGFGVKTNWIMHEFILHDRLLPPSDGASANKEVCHLY